MKQQIRFCKGFDGTRIAYATHRARGRRWSRRRTGSRISSTSSKARSGGRGSPRCRRAAPLVRMDERGCGLADRGVETISFEAFVRDLEAVVDAAGLERFALFGHSQGGAIAHRVRGAAPGTRQPPRAARRLRARPLQARRPSGSRSSRRSSSWSSSAGDATTRRTASSSRASSCPAATLEQLRLMSELQRVSSHARGRRAHPARALRHRRLRSRCHGCRCPTLVLHARGDLRVPLRGGPRPRGDDSGRALRAARVGTTTSSWSRSRRSAGSSRSCRPSSRAARQSFAGLTAREAQILEHIAQGLDNAQIAARLALSEKTVRNHITTSSTRSASRAAPRPSSSRASAAWDSGPGSSSPLPAVMGPSPHAAAALAGATSHAREARSLMQSPARKTKSRIRSARIRSVRWLVKPAQTMKVVPHEAAERLEILLQMARTKK